MLKVALKEIFRRDDTFRSLVMQTPVSILVLRGPSYIIEFANHRILDAFGLEWDEVAGKPFFELFPELENQGYRTILQKVYTAGEVFTAKEMSLQIFRKMASPRFVNFTIQPLKNSSGMITGVLGVGTDVTELVESRKAIEESEIKFRTVLDEMDRGFSLMEIIFDENNTPVDYMYLDVNPAVEKITGLKDVVGKSIKEVLPNLETYWIDLFGHVALTGERVTVTNTVAELNKTIETHAFRIGGEDSRKVAVFFSDVTTRVTEEEKRKQFAEQLKIEVAERTKELERSNKDLKHYAHVASHDLKEPVRKIRTFVSMLESGLADALVAPYDEYINRIKMSCDRIQEMVEGVLDYASADYEGFQFVEINLNEMVDRVINDLSMVIEDKKAFIRVKPLPIISGVNLLIYQLFYNLIHNSLKFSKTGKEIKIEIDSAVVEENGEEFSMITVSDNGIGFESEYNEKIFDSFVRLNNREKYEGSGLGLALCKKIVERHGGTISASGEKCKGATFNIKIPFIK